MSRRMLRRRFGPMAAFVSLALAATACFQPPAARVGVKPLAAELVFGIPTLDEPVGLPGLDEDIDPILDFSRPTRPVIEEEEEIPECPITPNKDVDNPATDKVNQPPPDKPLATPLQGQYRWKQSGSTRLKGSDTRIEHPDFDIRTVKGLQRLTDSTFNNTTREDYTFTVVQRHVLKPNAVWEMDYQVITSRKVKAQGEPVDPGDAAGNPFVQNQQNGIFLVEVRKRELGLNVRTFHPQPPITILPFPISQGQTTFDITSVDPDTFETWRMQGLVKNIMTVDACGQNTDGWFVDGTLDILQGDEGEEGKFEWDYTVATQLGGLIVFERQRFPCNTASDANPRAEYRNDPGYHGGRDCVIVTEEGDPNTDDDDVVRPTDFVFDTNIGQLVPEPLSEGSS